MSNEEDECDSSSLFPVASQSDVTSFLHAQAAKITDFNSSISDDDESSIDDQLLRSFTRTNLSKSCLSRSCFASISTQKLNPSDDLTELKWLNTFKFKEFQDQKTLNEDQISKLSNELKTYYHHEQNSISYGVMIFLALYSKSDDQQIPWSLNLKQLYEYIQINFKQITNKRGWKNFLKQTLITIPCFIKTKHDIPKLRSIWTIDPYYRPLLTKAYLTSLTLPTNKIISDKKQSESIVNNFAPKATVKTKALPRLYERLCEEKADDEADSNQIIKQQQRRTNSDRKRPRSASSSGHGQIIKDNNEKRPSSLNKRYDFHSNNESSSKKRMKSNEDDECDSNHSSRKSIITTRSQTAARSLKTNFLHRRKSSPPKKRLSLALSAHRPNTRINKKIIEQDLELLRQAKPIDLSVEKNSIEDILDLSLSR